MTKATTTETQPAISEVRAPQNRRDKISRPSSSVPSQCRREGALRTAIKSALIGSKGKIHGASNASSAKNSTNTAPITAVLLLMNLRNIRLGSRAGSDVVTEITETLMSGSPHTWVNQHIQYVGQQVHQQKAHRDHHHHTLNHRVITVENGIDNHLAETRNGEHLLAKHRAAEQFAEQQRRQRNNRYQRIAQRVFHDHLPGQ